MFPVQTNQSHAAINIQAQIQSFSFFYKPQQVPWKKKNQELTMKVSLKEAKMWATPKTNSPSLVAGPKVTVSSLGSLVLLLDYKSNTIHQRKLDWITLKRGKIIKQPQIYKMFKNHPLSNLKPSAYVYFAKKLLHFRIQI